MPPPLVTTLQNIAYADVDPSTYPDEIRPFVLKSRPCYGRHGHGQIIGARILHAYHPTGDPSPEGHIPVRHESWTVAVLIDWTDATPQQRHTAEYPAMIFLGN